MGDRVGQLEKGLLEIRNLFKQLVAAHQSTPPERSASSTTAGYRRSHRTLAPVPEKPQTDKEALMERNYREDARCLDRGVRLTFNSMDVTLKWRDRQYRGSNIDMRANEIQDLKGWKNLTNHPDLEKLLFILVKYVRFQFGDEQDLLTLVFKVSAQPLKEEPCQDQVLIFIKRLGGTWLSTIR